MKSLLTTLSIVLWIFSFHICNYFFSDSIDNWWKLRMILYALCYSLMVMANNIKGLSRYTLFINYLTLGLVMEDVTDRLFFDSRIYEWNDFLSLDISLGVAFYLTFKKEIYDFRA